MVTNTGVTVFNKTTDPATRTEILSRAFIPAVLYTETQGANVLQSGMESADSVKIYLTFDGLKRANKTHVDPKQFKNPLSQFTLTRGAIVVKGNVGEYATVKALEQALSHVHVITTVDYHDYGTASLQHIEIGCK